MGRPRVALALATACLPYISRGTRNTVAADRPHLGCCIHASQSCSHTEPTRSSTDPSHSESSSADPVGAKRANAAREGTSRLDGAPNDARLAELVLLPRGSLVGATGLEPVTSAL